MITGVAWFALVLNGAVAQIEHSVTESMASHNLPVQYAGGQTTDPIIGNSAKTTSGTVGRRQSATDAPFVNPFSRVNSRIDNRVQLRLRNRIDRNFIQRSQSAYKTAATKIEQPNQPK